MTAPVEDEPERPEPSVPTPEVGRTDNWEPFATRSALRSVPPERTASTAGAGTAYLTFLAAALAAEESRALALVGRGQHVTATSGGLVTAAVAIAAVGSQLTGLPLHLASRLLVLAAGGALLAAVVVASMVNRPERTRILDPAGLLDQLRERWADPGDRPDEKVAATQVALLRNATTLADRRAGLVTWAGYLQAAGIVMLALGLAALTGGW